MKQTSPQPQIHPASYKHEIFIKMFSGLQKALAEAQKPSIRNNYSNKTYYCYHFNYGSTFPTTTFSPQSTPLSSSLQPALSCRNNNDRTAAVITRKCNFSIGNYHGVSFSGVIATNLAKMHNILVVPDGSVGIFHRGICHFIQLWW